MTMIQDSYSHLTANWHRKAGRKPSTRQLVQAQRDLRIRAGTKTALVVAMALRPAGVTQDQIKMVLGATYRNRLNDLITSKKVIRLSNKDNARAMKIIVNDPKITHLRRGVR